MYETIRQDDNFLCSAALVAYNDARLEVANVTANISTSIVTNSKIISAGLVGKSNNELAFENVSLVFKHSLTSGQYVEISPIVGYFHSWWAPCSIRQFSIFGQVEQLNTPDYRDSVYLLVESEETEIKV